MERICEFKFGEFMLVSDLEIEVVYLWYCQINAHLFYTYFSLSYVAFSVTSISNFPFFLLVKYFVPYK